MRLNSLNRDMFKPVRSHNVCSVESLVACLRICTGFKGFPSERRINESALVGQTKLLS